MRELGCEESWAPKNWCFGTVVLEKTLESPLDCKEIQPVYPKGNQSWISVASTDSEAETPIFWPPDAKNWLTRQDPEVGKNWRRQEKGTIEDEMVRWHHCLDGHEFEKALGVGDGQGSLACCSPRSRKELDMTEQLYWIEQWWLDCDPVDMIWTLLSTNCQEGRSRQDWSGIADSLTLWILWA